MSPLSANPSTGLAGTVSPPGDKSISHRALILGALCVGRSTVHGLLEGEDVLATADALRAMGALIEKKQTKEGRYWEIFGRGVGGLREADDVLDLGNSGTGVRLLMGVAAAHPFHTFFTGDASLRKRPMGRVIEPLTKMGAVFDGHSGDRLPLSVTGPETILPLDYTLPVASAQVKSAILLAGLNGPGDTIVHEPVPSRDHTELMLRHFGADINIERKGKGLTIRLRGQPELEAKDVRVPGDISSAAFPIIAALITKKSEITLENIGINPLRTGLLDTLKDMGAALDIEETTGDNAEPLATITVRSSRLKGVTVPPHRVPAMIDEFPVLAVAAACATGKTVMRGLGELRLKESDRIAAVEEGLRACGVSVKTGKDWMEIEGAGNPPRGGTRIATRLDHRIAMSFLVLGLAAKKPVSIDDGQPIDTSFPNFVDMMRTINADIVPGTDEDG